MDRFSNQYQFISKNTIQMIGIKENLLIQNDNYNIHATNNKFND